MASRVSIDVVTNTGGSDRAITGLRGHLQALGTEAKKGLFTGIGLSAGVMGWQAVGSAIENTIGYMKDAVGNALADEQSQSLLGAALEANVKHWDGNTAAIEDTIESRLKLGFADEQQREGLRILVAQTKDYNTALDLQRTAMDLARLRGMDLVTASTLIGKVYGGNIGILTRYGIQLKEGTTATEAITAVQKMATGQAEAYSRGVKGSMESLGIAFDEIQEKVGYALLPTLKDLADWALNEGIPALDDLADHIGDLVDAVSVLWNIFLTLTGPARAITSFIFDVGRNIAGLIGDLLGLSDASSAMSEEWAGAWQDVAGSVTTQGGYIVSAAKHVANDAAHDLGDIPRKAADKIKDNQFHFRDAILEMEEFAKGALTRSQEVNRILGFLNSRAVSRGLASGNSLVRKKWEEMVEDAKRRLENLGPVGHAAGVEFMMQLYDGISSKEWLVTQKVAHIAAVIAGNFHGSEPKNPSSPLRNMRAKGGMIPRLLAEGMLAELGTARGASSALANALAVNGGGGYRGGTGRGMAGPGGMGGGGITINLPPTTVPYSAAQYQDAARNFAPELVRELRRQGYAF